jgi:hypothetical protein
MLNARRLAKPVLSVCRLGIEKNESLVVRSAVGRFCPAAGDAVNTRTARYRMAAERVFRHRSGEKLLAAAK